MVALRLVSCASRLLQGGKCEAASLYTLYTHCSSQERLQYRRALNKVSEKLVVRILLGSGNLAVVKRYIGHTSELSGLSSMASERTTSMRTFHGSSVLEAAFGLRSAASWLIVTSELSIVGIGYEYTS